MLRSATADSTSIYVVRFRVREPGKYWLLTVPEGKNATVRAVGNVDMLSSDPVPGIGDPAPLSATPTLAAAGGDAANVTTEPWTFVVDRHGRVSSRFQGAVSIAELERAVERVARRR